MKKLFALLLSLVMIMALAAPATAAGGPTTGTITITNAVAGQKYTIYKVFDLTYNEDGAKVPDGGVDAGQPAQVSYTYTKTGASDGLYDALADTASPFTLTATSAANVYQVTLKDPSTSGETIATFLKGLVNGGKLTKYTKTGLDNPVTVADNENTAVFDDVDFGYYYIESSVGAVVMVNSATPNIEIQSKNSAPTLKYDGDTDGTGSNRAAGYGDAETFTLTLTAGAGAQNYVVHVTVPAGLTYDSTTGITVQKAAWNETNNNNDAAADVTATDNYTVDTITDTNLADGLDFTVTFEESFMEGLKEKDQIIITYKATVNDGQGSTTAATIRDAGNKSEAYVSYGAADPAETSPKTSDTVYVYDLTVSKYYKDSSNSDAVTALPGAKFKIYKSADTKTYYAQVTGGKLTGWTETEADGTELESGAISGDKSTFKVEGLDAGEYFLVETEAPEGFNILTAPVVFRIDAKYDADAAGNNIVVKEESGYPTTDPTPYAENNTIEVENNSGSRLPSTGGIGTTIFYIVGSVLAVGAIILLITKKKMSDYDEQK